LFSWQHWREEYLEEASSTESHQEMEEVISRWERGFSISWWTKRKTEERHCQAETSEDQNKTQKREVGRHNSKIPQLPS
jgi:hypothetical protein